MLNKTSHVMRSAALPVLMALALLASSFNYADASGNCTYQCYTGLGRTIGFWQNPNGKNVLSGQDTAWRDRLNQFCLVNANGSSYSVPAGNFNTAHNSFKSWLLGPVKGNSAYMLSKQFAAAVLNVEFGFMDHLDNHYVDWNGNKTNIQDLFNDANALLCQYPLTTGNATGKAEQESLKDLFDALNNNTIPVCVRICQPPVLTTTILATKFYDVNLNGVFDEGEDVIAGWPIELRASDGTTVLQSGVTDTNGEISWIVPMDNTDYVVVEIMQEPYINISAISQNITADSALAVVDFGNVAIQCTYGLGKTRGFWMNNGASPPATAALAACFPHWAHSLNALNLVDNTGNLIADFSTTDAATAHSQLLAWEGQTPQNNPAFQLAIQFAVMVLNVECGDMSGHPGIFVEWNGVKQNVYDVFAVADQMLNDISDANPANDPSPAEMEALKNFFDALNKNYLSVYVVLPGPVPFGPLPCTGSPPAVE